MLKHILVPVDGTDYSWRALDYAADLAALSGGELFIVTIVREGGNPIGSAPLRSEEEVEAVSYTHLDVYKRQTHTVTRKEIVKAIRWFLL